MTKLGCTVTSCIHNADSCCCKQAILVDGREAKEKCQTCCQSFDENKDGSFKNLFKTPELRLEIDCEAVNCVYNESRHCVADKIDITGSGASKAEETECASFVAR